MASGDPDLYLHEVVDIVGRGGAPYMAHVVAFDAEAVADRALELVGSWEVVGTTGRWPQVVNLWSVVDGWDGWGRLAQRTNVRKSSNPELAEWWDEAHKHRTGGYDRLLRAAPGCPTLPELRAGGVTGTVFVHELTQVPQGGADAYLAAVIEEWAPQVARYGCTLVHASSTMWVDDEVCTIWATDVEGHLALERATDLDSWPARRRALTTRWREELMTPGAGTPLAR